MLGPLMARGRSSGTAHLRRRESPRSGESLVPAKPEDRRQAVEHAQIHGGAAQALYSRSSAHEAHYNKGRPRDREGLAFACHHAVRAYADRYGGRARSFNCFSVNLALVWEFGSSFLLPLRFEYPRAAEMILLGKPFDALRAAELGLVTQVLPDQNLLSTATETARTLAAKSAAAVQATKRLMERA